jgi:hypothetical protein
MGLPLQSSHAASTELHPAVNVAAAALLMWFVTAACMSFGGADDIGLALAIVGVLAFMVIAIPFALWRASAKARSNKAAAAVSNETEAAGKPDGVPGCAVTSRH